MLIFSVLPAIFVYIEVCNNSYNQTSGFVKIKDDFIGAEHFAGNIRIPQLNSKCDCILVMDCNYQLLSLPHYMQQPDCKQVEVIIREIKYCNVWKN